MTPGREHRKNNSGHEPNVIHFPRENHPGGIHPKSFRFNFAKFKEGFEVGSLNSRWCFDLFVVNPKKIFKKILTESSLNESEKRRAWFKAETFKVHNHRFPTINELKGILGWIKDTVFWETLDKRAIPCDKEMIQDMLDWINEQPNQSSITADDIKRKFYSG